MASTFTDHSRNVGTQYETSRISAFWRQEGASRTLDFLEHLCTLKSPFTMFIGKMTERGKCNDFLIY
jgi:hypothetical protein